MGLAIDIYGSLVYSPDVPLDTFIDGFGLPITEQYWRRRELPDFFDRVDVDKDGNVFLTPEQVQYAKVEVDRCKNGFWFFNRGVPTYISGKNYFYLNYWKLEDDIYPEYRDTDRRYFLFLDHWEKILWCLGIIRGKKRREGASSQATSNLVYEAIFYTNSNCGLISKSRDDSRDTFTDMVSFGYRQLPIFLKPKQLNDPDSVTELVFAHKTISVKDGKAAAMSSDAGHRSKINYRAPVLNAYDRGRLSRVLLDEFGKLDKDVPASQLYKIISKCLVKGIKRVGFCEMPSTVNKLTKGGAEFKLLWKLANQFKVVGPTLNRLVRYFTSAADGLEGFIDRYGMSVVGEPTHEQYQYLVDKWVKKDANSGMVISEVSEDDIKLGAYAYLLKRREGLEGDELEEEIRMNPLDEDELFMSADAGSPFNTFKINKRLKELEESPVYKRKIVFERDIEGKVIFRDAQKAEEVFCWQFTQLPKEDKRNKYKYDANLRIPSNQEDGVISVDGYSNSQGGRKYGSKASAWVFLKFDLNDPANTGKFVGHLYGRPKDKNDLHNQVMLAAEYWGFKVYYEFNADDYYTYFRDRGKLGYLGRFPLATIDPEKRKKEKVERHYGFPTTPFSLTKQLDTMITYVENYCEWIDFEPLLENLKPFDPYDRTSYDCVVAAMIGLVSSTETVNKPKPPKEPLVKSYVNSHYSGN